MHVVGALAYVAAIGLSIVGIVVVSIVTSYNTDTPTTGDRISVKFGYLVVAALLSSVPFGVGVIARRRRTAAVPWFVLAALTALYAILVALQAAPVKAPTIY